MNWKTEAKEKLRKYDAMVNATINIPEEIAMLESMHKAIHTRKMDEPSIVRGESTHDEKFINNIAKRQELKWALKNAKSWVKLVENALECLLPDEKLIVQKLYIYPSKGAVKELCEELEITDSTLYRRRDQALERFTLALYGSTGIEP